MGFLLEAGAAEFTPYLVGGTALLVLVIALWVVLGIGGSRPHS